MILKKTHGKILAAALALALSLLCAEGADVALEGKFANAFGWTDTGMKLKRSEIAKISADAEGPDASAKFMRGVMLYRAYLAEARDVPSAVRLFRESAELGSPCGMAAYAACLLNGDASDPDPKKADSLFKKSAAAGCALAVRYVGEGLLKSARTLDMQMGVEFLKSAEALGDVYSKTILASCYDRGIGVPSDPGESARLLKEAADAGNAPALFAMGMLASRRGEDARTVFRLYEKAAMMKYPPALSALGVCYLYGAGVPADYGRAVSYLELAAAEGVAGAQNALGVCYANGAGVEQDPGRAFEWFKRAAQLGDAEAQNNLGNCYYFGKGAPEDAGQAHKWFRLAAAQGNASAQSSLALLYLEGKAQKRDAKDAVVWLLKAAEGGDVEAQSNLGRCLLEGIGTETNYPLAVKWLALAAEKDDAQALGNLGGCYYLGLGVEKDLEKAKELLKKAAKLGNDEARKAYWRISDE